MHRRPTDGEKELLVGYSSGRSGIEMPVLHISLALHTLGLHHIPHARAFTWLLSITCANPVKNGLRITSVSAARVPAYELQCEALIDETLLDCINGQTIHD
jgi:hypothetical protein